MGPLFLLTVNDGAVLAGSGVVGSTASNSGGIFSPALWSSNITVALTILSDLSLQPGSQTFLNVVGSWSTGAKTSQILIYGSANLIAILGFVPIGSGFQANLSPDLMRFA